MKEFFGKTWVAVTVLILSMAAAITIGQLKKNYNTKVVVPTDIVFDDAGILTEETVDLIRGYNRVWSEMYSTRLAVVTVDSVRWVDMEDYARECFDSVVVNDDKAGARIGLSENDALLLIAVRDKQYYFLVGEKLQCSTVFTDSLGENLTETMEQVMGRNAKQTRNNVNIYLPVFFSQLDARYVYCGSQINAGKDTAVSDFIDLKGLISGYTGIGSKLINGVFGLTGSVINWIIRLATGSVLGFFVVLVIVIKIFKGARRK